MKSFGPEHAKTIPELARRLNLSTKAMNEILSVPSQRKAIVSAKGYHVETALRINNIQKQQEIQRLGGGTSDMAELKRERLRQQIREAECKIRMLALEEKVHRVEYEAKLKLWFSREETLRLANLFAGTWTDAVRAVELLTHDARIVESCKTIFDSARNKAAKELGGWDRIPQTQPESKTA